MRTTTTTTVRTLAFAVTSLVLLAQACSSDDPSGGPDTAGLPGSDAGQAAGPDTKPEDLVAPDEVDVDLALDGATLEAYAISASEHNGSLPVESDVATWDWEFEDATTHQITAMGHMADPRVVVAEFDASGNAARDASTRTNAALFQVTVPNSGGQLRFSQSAPGQAPAPLGQIDLTRVAQASGARSCRAPRTARTRATRRSSASCAKRGSCTQSAPRAAANSAS